MYCGLLRRFHILPELCERIVLHGRHQELLSQREHASMKLHRGSVGIINVLKMIAEVDHLGDIICIVVYQRDLAAVRFLGVSISIRTLM